MLFNALNAFSELPSQMMGRPITYKQVGYRFYRPGALAVAQTLADFPFNALQIFLFLIIIYFMAGLYASAGAFFTGESDCMRYRQDHLHADSRDASQPTCSSSWRT